MDQHAFVNKPFYKWFCKCIECKKRLVWTQIAKCSGCKNYCHRRCIQPNNDECCGSNHDKSTAQMMESDLKTVVTWPEEDIIDFHTAEIEIVENRPENSADVSHTENSNLSEAIDDDVSTPDGSQNAKDATAPSEDEADSECTKALTNEEVQTDEPMSSSSIHRPAKHMSDTCCWMNMEFPQSCWPTRIHLLHTKQPTQDCSAFKLDSSCLPCLEIKIDERRIDEESVEKNKSCDGDFEKNKTSYDDGGQRDVPEHQKLN